MPVEIKVVIVDIIRVMQQVGNREIVFVRRSANGVADSLAKDGLQGFGTQTWEARPPVWLFSLLEEDNYLA